MQLFINKFKRTIASHTRACCLNRSQYSYTMINRVQLAKLLKLIDYCRRHVKYYQEVFQEVGSIGTLEDISKLPILTKQDIRKRFWDFLPKELPACRVYRTSGSSGIPICILSDESSRVNNSAAIIRYHKIYGMKNLRTAILTPLKKKSDLIPGPHWTYVQGIHKTYYVNPYAEEKGQVELGIRALSKCRYPAIIGITPAIKALAHQINDGIYPPISPIAVLTVGESLDEITRSSLEKTFRVKVNDIYACSEAGDVAWQCPNSSLYHVNAENCILEILDEKNNPVHEGEVGEVVITNLNRFSMPFIRYKNGDLARASYHMCPCGRKLPVFQEIIGRSGEDFFLPNGQTLQWNVLKSAMNHNLIRQFQLIQNPDASMTVKYVPEESCDMVEVEDLLKRRLNTLVHNSLPVHFQIVGDIPREPSGKSKLVICNYRNTPKVKCL